MKLSFELQVNAKKEHIWEYYSNLEKWNLWEKDLETISLEGDFVTGTKGKMKLKEMPEMDIMLTSVIKEQEFIDTSQTPIGNISFGHFIFEKNNKLYIKHEVSLEESNEKYLEFLTNVFSAVPKTMFLLKKEVENNEK